MFKGFEFYYYKDDEFKRPESVIPEDGEYTFIYDICDFSRTHHLNKGDSQYMLLAISTEDRSYLIDKDILSSRYYIEECSINTEENIINISFGS